MPTSPKGCLGGSKADFLHLLHEKSKTDCEGVGMWGYTIYHQAEFMMYVGRQWNTHKISQGSPGRLLCTQPAFQGFVLVGAIGSTGIHKLLRQTSITILGEERPSLLKMLVPVYSVKRKSIMRKNGGHFVTLCTNHDDTGCCLCVAGGPAAGRHTWEENSWIQS